MSSAPTAFSGSSFARHYKGAWCTPPRIFIDQDEIIPHLEPGRVPSTVDPDSMDPTERTKQNAKRPVHIRACKLAKLDSNEAMKAAAKARASSSVLIPINTRAQYEADRCSSDNLSCRSRVMSADTGHHIDTRSGRNSQYKSPLIRPAEQVQMTLSCIPRHRASSRAIRGLQDLWQSTIPQSISTQFVRLQQAGLHFQLKQSRVNEAAVSEAKNARRFGAPNEGRSSRSSVYWDREAGRFVSAQANQGSGSRLGRPYLLYTGQSIFFGGPLMTDPATRFRWVSAAPAPGARSQ